MTLTLVVPQLIWPHQVMRDTLYDLNFPALETLLGMGRLVPSPQASADHWWRAQFGLSNDALPAAALRMTAWGIDTGSTSWLCADPVHLRVDKRGATVADPALLAVSAEEAEQLQAHLAPLFAAVGALSVARPGAWHLRLAQEAPAFPQHLLDLVGQSATALLPAGEAGRNWRSLINDVQIALHDHPVNRTREARGMLPINSIALWGAGRLPAVTHHPRSALFSDDPLLAGLGRLAGLEVKPLPTGYAEITEDTIVDWDRLLLPSFEHDALCWRKALLHLENAWLAPALADLAKGKLNRMALHGFGDATTVSASLARIDRWKFWRQPRRLETLAEAS
jgi:hypothetical protein